LTSATDTKSLIETGVRRLLQEVPALAGLKLVVALELRGRGDVQLYRVEMPGPKVTKDVAADARVRLSVPRSDFNELATEGHARQWREAFETGHAKAEGSPEILKLIETVVARQEERARTRKVRG
jgi:hypothetical protein